MLLGTISELFCYPVKGCGEIQLDQAMLVERGIRYDREWMLVDNATDKFLSQRSHPKLALVRAKFDSNYLRLSAPEVSGKVSLHLPFKRNHFGEERVVTVHSKTCYGFDCDPAASAWFSSYLNMDCRLMRFANKNPIKPYGEPRANISFADAQPLLVISEGSLADLNKRLAEQSLPSVPMNRFRPNIVLAGCKFPYMEDKVIMDSVVIGASMKLKGGELCVRCKVTTIDQETGEQGKEPLKTLAGYRRMPEGGVVFGRNFTHLTRGTIRVGDSIKSATY